MYHLADQNSIVNLKNKEELESLIQNDLTQLKETYLQVIDRYKDMFSNKQI